MDNSKQLTKSQVTSYRSLKRGKVRKETGLFLLEGERLCGEALEGPLKIQACILGPRFQNQQIPEEIPVFHATHLQIEQIADSQSPQEFICIAEIPGEQALPTPGDDKLCLALDRISDPGNLGTILRTARWFGICDVILSPDCADPFSPKVVRSAMGAIGVVDVHRNIALTEFADDWTSSGGDALALHMNGEPLNHIKTAQPTLLVVGSEAHGIHPELMNKCRQASILQIGSGESLNAAISAGIALWELRK